MSIISTLSRAQAGCRRTFAKSTPFMFKESSNSWRKRKGLLDLLSELKHKSVGLTTRYQIRLQILDQISISEIITWAPDSWDGWIVLVGEVWTNGPPSDILICCMLVTVDCLMVNDVEPKIRGDDTAQPSITLYVMYTNVIGLFLLQIARLCRKVTTLEKSLLFNISNKRKHFLLLLPPELVV